MLLLRPHVSPCESQGTFIVTLSSLPCATAGSRVAQCALACEASLSVAFECNIVRVTAVWRADGARRALSHIEACGVLAYPRGHPQKGEVATFVTIRERKGRILRTLFTLVVKIVGFAYFNASTMLLDSS